MGVAISGWRLARAVACEGQLGVVSGTALDLVFARRLQDAGIDEELAGVLAAFPDQAVVERVCARYAVTLRKSDAPYRGAPMPTHRMSVMSTDLMVLGSFVEVALAKKGHSGLVGINLLTKVEIPTVPTLFGAMLAGVDYVIMGAGVPRHIPNVLDSLAKGEIVHSDMTVTGVQKGGSTKRLSFDPAVYREGQLRRPKFLAIVSSNVLATALVRKATGVIDGLIVEGPGAGGHNAPPRGPLQLDEKGAPVYGPRDVVDLEALRQLSTPFWIAGGMVNSERREWALAQGAVGIQVGTLFALCQESGMSPELKSALKEQCISGGVRVSTSARASSTGYPFKVASLPGSLSDPKVYEHRVRKCDLGYLREAYETDKGSIGYRCAAEPPDQFVAKGGALEATVGRICLCNGLAATAGLGQYRRVTGAEPPIVTSGDEINAVVNMMEGNKDYTARDVITFLSRPSAATNRGELTEVGVPSHQGKTLHADVASRIRDAS